MLIPVRCFTCGRVIAEEWEIYKNRVMAGEDPKKVLNDLGIIRPCCRRMFISHPIDPNTGTEPIDEIIKYG